jgi:hypothetical protein
VLLMFERVELSADIAFSIPVDVSNKVKLWECNQNPQQQWIFTDDGLLTLANNTSSLPEVIALVDYY